MTDQDAVAQIEANVANVVEKLTDWARHMAARFNGSVYLVGSILHNPTPRDCDLRIVISDHEFAARYGMELHPTELGEFHPLRKRSSLVSASLIRWREEGPTQLWVDDLAKFGGELSVTLKRNVDVKVWPDSHWHPPYPTPVTLAAPTPRFFYYTKHCTDPALSVLEGNKTGVVGEVCF